SLPPLAARPIRVAALLDDCAREIRGLAAVAADPDASHDARLAAAAWRVESAVHALVPPVGPARRATAEVSGAPTHHPGAEAALTHLQGLEQALVALAAPVRTSPSAPLVPAA
ncbi:FUSC family protein, partial [Streptomyces sp. NPDC046316]